MSSKKGDEKDKDAFTLHSTDGSFIIKPRKIKVEKSRKKKKKDVKTELENTKMDMIQ